MWKKVVLLIVLCLTLTACNSTPESLEGYWMDEGGNTVSFNSDGKAIIGGISYDYSIYDENNVSISFFGLAKELRFEIKSDILTLTNLDDNSTQLFYRDEKKQAEIQEKVAILEQEKAEQMRFQQELLNTQKEQEEYEKYIRTLINDIDNIENEIAKHKTWIVEEQGWITDIDADIAEVQHSGDMLASEQIISLKEEQTGYRKDITQYQQEIAKLKIEKTAIKDTLKYNTTDYGRTFQYLLEEPISDCRKIFGAPKSTTSLGLDEYGGEAYEDVYKNFTIYYTTTRNIEMIFITSSEIDVWGCKYGMTGSEIKKILGPPTSIWDPINSDPYFYLVYSYPDSNELDVANLHFSFKDDTFTSVGKMYFALPAI